MADKKLYDVDDGTQAQLEDVLGTASDGKVKKFDKTLFAGSKSYIEIITSAHTVTEISEGFFKLDFSGGVSYYREVTATVDKLYDDENKTTLLRDRYNVDVSNI